MRIAVLSARSGWHTDELRRALDERGHEGIVLPYEGLLARLGARSGLSSEGTSLDDVDAVLARIIPNGSLEQIIYRVDALHCLEDSGIPVFVTLPMYMNLLVVWNPLPLVDVEYLNPAARRAWHHGAASAAEVVTIQRRQ